MIFVWSIVGGFIVVLLLFGYLVDKKTNRYKGMGDKNEGAETIKDDMEKHNPPRSNHTSWW